MTRIRGDADVLTFQKHTRSWIQTKGPGPASELELFALYGALGGLDMPEGSSTPVWRRSLAIRNAYRKVGESIDPPDTYTASIQEGIPRASANFLLRARKSREKFAVQAVVHQDASPVNPTAFESKLIVEGLRVSSVSITDVEAFEGDEEVRVEAELEFDWADFVYPIMFGEEASSEIDELAVATAVWPSYDAGHDDEKEIYIVQQGDGAAASPKLIWSHDGGATWTATSISDLGVSDHPTDIILVGEYGFICSNAGESYVWFRRADPTTLAEITGGFVASKGPNAMWAKDLANVFMVGDGGYIYKLDMVGLAVEVVSAGVETTENLTAIDGQGNVIVAVGANNALVYSTNGGKSWALGTGPSAGVALNTVQVIDNGRDEIWHVGSDGEYYSYNRGSAWTEKSLPVTVSTVNDIKFSEELDGVGYLAYETATPEGGVLRTTDGGQSWEADSITALPDCDAIDDLAVGGPNYVVAVGDLDGADGIAAIAVPA